MAMTIFALSILAAGFTLMSLTLQHRVPMLRAKEQAFRFHALRDQLQLLAVEGRISTTSVGYKGLLRMLNIAIRNAGLMKLGEMLRTAESAKDTIDNKPTFEKFEEDIQRHDAAIQQLASDCFSAYVYMLISNDSLVRVAFMLANWTVVKPVFRHLRRLLTQLVPTHTEAVDLARWYSSIGGRFAAT
jgi:hypothetical protein